MTLWNPMNVFSGQQRSAGGELSASFDPSRTGDPLGPRPGNPAIGSGGTRVGSGAAFGDPRRNPIGFAPSEERTSVTRYRTEISFKRHHEQPRASATPGRPDSPEPAIPDTAVEDVPSAGEAVPFYKREISFRRKRETPGEAAAAVAAGDAVEDGAEVVAQADDHEEPVALVAAVEPVVDVDPGPVAEVTSTQPAEEARPPEPAALEREEDQAAALEETDLGRVVAAASPSPVNVAESGDELPAVEDAVPLPVAVSEETPEPEGSPGREEAPVSEAPAPAGRFASRKGRSTEKRAGRRKSGQGGKDRKVVGLKIGASQIAASVVAETEAGHELLELARRPLAEGIVVDGEVRDEDALVTAVKALFDEEKLPRHDVRIGLSSNRIGVRTIDIVGSDDDARFDNAVRFKAHEVLPVSLHESVLDYRVIDERPGEGAERVRRVLLVVAPRDQVEPYQRVADRAGITLTGIDLEALGLLRAFVEPKLAVAPKADDTAIVVVAIGHESSTLLVAGGGTCEFTRVFDWGGSALEDAIVTSLDVRPAEAATMLRHLSLSGPGRQYESLDDATRAKATEAVRLRLTPFARELVNSLQFYQTQAESLGIGGIVITGGTSHLEGLSDALHQMIGVDVSVGDPFARVIPAGDFDPAIEAVIGSMAVPIGLAIEDMSMRGVNLLPTGAVAKRSRRSTMIAIGAPVAVAVPLVALGLLYLGAHGQVADRQSQLESVRAEIAALPKPVVPVIDAAVVGDEAVRATAVASVLGGRLAWDAVFRDMSRVLPENVWLTSLSLTQPAPGNLADTATAAGGAQMAGQPPATPTAVSIDGFTYTQPDVARLLARLATLPSLQTVTLSTSDTQVVGEKKVVHFVIVADLNTGGVS